MSRWQRPLRPVAQRLRPVATAAERWLTPGLAGAALLSVTVVTALLLALVGSLTAAPGDSGGVLMRSLNDPAPAGEPPPPHQPPQAQVAAPIPSPAAGTAGTAAGDDDSPPAQPPTAPEQTDFISWAILDRATGEITGSETLAETSTTASMIKAWLVADYLRQTPDPSPRLPELSLIIRDSDNPLTQALFHDLGQHESIERLIDVCGLADSQVVPNSWSSTRLSARDTARMGACLADGSAAGPDWTDWLLDEMRQVRGVGDFGIRHAFPAGQRSSIAIKNGWVIRTEEHAWHLNCLAVSDGWSMGVLTRYPADRGYHQGGHEQGAEICRSIAEQHLLPRLG